MAWRHPWPDPAAASARAARAGVPAPPSFSDRRRTAASRARPPSTARRRAGGFVVDRGLATSLMPQRRSHCPMEPPAITGWARTALDTAPVPILRDHRIAKPEVTRLLVPGAFAPGLDECAKAPDRGPP